MMLKSTPVRWVIFFLVSLLVCGIIAYSYIEPREIVISDLQAETIALKIAKNEDTDKRLNLIRWHREENYPILGLASFIWHSNSENVSEPSFNGFLTHLDQSHALPDWLVGVKEPLWGSHEEFLSNSRGEFENKLRDFLQDTMDEQIQYLILKLEAKLPKMLKEVKNPFAKMHVYENFYHVAVQENGVYALLDYWVFMGDGISSGERYNNQGWGLLHVLENTKGDSDNLVQTFVSSAELLLTRRVENAPVDERKFLHEWRRRLHTYVYVP